MVWSFYNSSGELLTGGDAVTQFNVDDALGATPAGTLAITKRDDVLSALTPIEGDAVELRVDSTGALWVATDDTINVAIASTTPDLMLGTDFSDVLGTASLILATQADDIANTVDAIQVSAFGYAFDGTTWDRMRGTSADGLLVNLGANNDVTITGTVTVTDDGAFNLAANSGVDIGDVDVLSIIPGTGATNLGKAEDAVHTTGDVGVMVLAVRQDTQVDFAADGDYVPFSINDSGELRVFASPFSAASLMADNAPNPTVTVIGANPSWFDGSTWDRARGDSTDGLLVNLGSNNDVTVTSGTIDVLGDAAHDAAATTDPVLISGIAQDMDDTAPPNRVDTEGDRTRVATDFDGTVFVHPHGPQVWSYHSNGSAALTDDTVHAAPGAGLSLYVTDIVFSSNAATAIDAFFEEGATTVLGPYALEATTGRGMSVHFQTPKKITANTALTVTTSAAIAHAVDVTGFVAQG